MSTLDTQAALKSEVRDAIVDLLYRLADDEIVVGHRNSEWTGLAPILEEDIAFSSMAQDEMGHALAYYRLLEELGEGDPDALVFGRSAEQYRCASLVSLPRGDWAFSVMRQFLYDTAESVRLRVLAESGYQPLAQLARKLQSEEKYHLLHGRNWVLRLGSATDESKQRMQAALDEVFPHAMGLFEPTAADEMLDQHDIAPREDRLLRQWESAVAPVLAEGGLKVPDRVEPMYGGRTGKHPASLQQLLDDMQLVYRTDPGAKW